MTIDISPVTTSRTDSLAISCVYGAESRGIFEDCLSGASLSSDVEVSGNVDDNGGCITLRIRVLFGYTGECARCLDPVSGTFDALIERTVCTDTEIPDETDEDYVSAPDGNLDLDDVILEELLLTFPTKLLCSETCPGICPKCGKKKMDGECGCDKKEIDPRLKILEQLLEK
ncbi:MAG: DUF177 domain-containing protein [Clostridia bacterium]|nr:DUF177 domain-containing protein [Clostridia bacterium]